MVTLIKQLGVLGAIVGGQVMLSINRYLQVYSVEE